MIKPVPTKTESVENRQSGIEGLGVAVIELAVEDLKQWNSHTKSAIYFLKSAPELLEFWLSAATYQGQGRLNLEIAKQQLYKKACIAEQNLLGSHKKNSKSAQLSKQKTERQR